jgi:hypothetical protein
MESGKSRSVMAENDQIRNAARNTGGQRRARDLAEVAACNRPGAYPCRFVRRCSEVSICHGRILSCKILSCKAPRLDLVVPARGRHPSGTARVRAVVALRICVVIRTDARRRSASVGETVLAPARHRADEPCSVTLSNKAASASACQCVSPKPRPNRFPRSWRNVIRLFESVPVPGRSVRHGREQCRPSMSRMSGRHARPRLDRGDQRLARR